MEEKSAIKIYSADDNRTQALMSMEVGEVIAFPVSLLTSLRSLSSSVGLTSDRVYRTSVNRSDRLITVTRVS